MRITFSFLSIAALLLLTGQAAGKQPWEWTSQERADARRDPAKRLERVRLEEAEQRRLRIDTSHLPKSADVIDGNRNPELFFVTELFEHLVRSAFVTLPDAYPHVVRQRTSDLFKDSAEWERFRKIAADYAQVLKEEHVAANALDKRAVSMIEKQKCAAEAHALREARRAFGKTRFDRMLYKRVPVSMKSSFSADTNFEISIGSALDRDLRCQ
jgi:hypothetical protein